MTPITRVPTDFGDHVLNQEDTRERDVAAAADGAKVDREQHVHRLGNLTLTGYNNKLGNKSFAEKRARKDQRGRLVGYRNGLYLNKALRTMQRWRVEDIKARTQQLAKEALRLFKL